MNLKQIVLEEISILHEAIANYPYDKISHWANLNKTHLYILLQVAAFNAGRKGKHIVRTAEEFENILQYSGLKVPPGGYDMLVKYLFKASEEELAGDETPNSLRGALQTGFSAGKKKERHA